MHRSNNKQCRHKGVSTNVYQRYNSISARRPLLGPKIYHHESSKIWIPLYLAIINSRKYIQVFKRNNCHKKGHLARVRKNIQSTKREHEEDPFDIIQEQKSHEVFLVILDTQNIKATAYSDLTGAFPYTAASGDRYICVFYSYDANAIVLECMKS